ncbi:RNA polymerase factor sigma-54 [Clostridium perfringens]|uniref:RNA polymerase factor sigma-54 n=2 Tax=Clostridium perfringens TaxID=1502 RepID=A0AAW4J3M1_CLOPF|nr:RNA polymerase factor sigma-54 [Clostridium perfringens]STB12753.1 RNA polymerase factor sigma-54 [Clostridium novyi]AOY54077.1 RNA polymerase sigma-54 factor RpoN [Clostridium perfringens]EDT70663.1 RNA polymerase sigma-54 factor [Clostridium perfringens D str. JGS1721]EDT77272.1 RNA polymerase sigma-54 factor [Clostridium perfringens NCTC 8239]EHA1004778.1 RNA polymerase factor sigma-54 [Clostridium perfringens]
MLMDFNLNLTQEQKLIMTQQMQLSIKLLQMSTYDLREYIEKEFSENPVLEAQYEDTKEVSKEQDRLEYKELVKYLESDNYGSQSYGEYDEEGISPFTFISKPESLTDYLEGQILELPIDEYMRSVCSYMVECLDQKGYLDIKKEELMNELDCSEETFNRALIVIQNLEPAGIGARDLKECLEIQLERKGENDPIVKEIIDNHLDDLADNRYQVIAKDLDITPKKAQDYGDLIKTLEPKPSRGFYTGDEVGFIIPDAEIRKIDGEFFILMKDGVLPMLSVNPLYKDILKDSTNDKEATEYVKEKIDKAMFLIKSIEQRKSTLHKVLQKILEKQKDYFEKGEKYLKPMTLKEIAEKLEMHESTISRAIRDKYILTSMGTIKIKDLFVNSISNKEKSDGEEDVTVINIKKVLEEVIKEEDKRKPLSDQAISEILKEKGMAISRRTVAKYREELGIKSSSKRKRF